MRKVYFTLSLIFYTLFPCIHTYAQQTVGLFTKNNGSQDGFVLFNPNYSTNAYLIDKCGKKAHTWNTNYDPGADSYILPNGNLLATAKLSNPYFNSSGSFGGMLQMFDWSGKLLWKYTISDTIEKQDHDVYPLANGNILVCEWERFTAAQAIAAGMNFGKSKGYPLWSAKVQEIKPSGTNSAVVVWQWRLWDHLIQDFDPAKANYGVVKDHPELFNINYIDSIDGSPGSSDWIHLNGVTYNPKLDQVMMSSRNMSEIWIVDHSTTTAQAAAHSGGKRGKGGDFIYRWGNPSAYNRDPTGNKRTLYVQHNPSWIPNGYPGAGMISVFNDGTNRAKGSYSSADVIAPPVDANGNYYLASGEGYGPDSASWSYTAPVPTDLYSSTQGSVQRLPNGNTLICEADSGVFLEVDSSKKLVWKYANPVGSSGVAVQGKKPSINFVFKCQWYSVNDPAFDGKNMTPGTPIELNPNIYACSMPYNFSPAPLYQIAQLKSYNATTGVADSVSKGQGYIKGVVVSQLMGPGGPQFSVADLSGAIMVNINAPHLFYTPQIGDSIMAGGYVSQVAGLTEYVADTIIILTAGSGQIMPETVSELSESNESDLVTLRNVSLVDTSQWSHDGEGFQVQITNGRDTFAMFIDHRTDLYKLPPLNERFNVTGIEIQQDVRLPYLSGYIIEPRSSKDIQRITQLYKIRQMRAQDPMTGISDSAGRTTDFYLKGIVQSPDFNILGLEFSIKDSTGTMMVLSSMPVNGYKPAIGDSVLLRGLLTQVSGMTAMVPDSVSKLANAHPVLIPQVVSALSEKYEAGLVSLNKYHIINVSQWLRNAGGIDVAITNGTDTVVMHMGQATDLYNMAPPQGVFSVTGIELQNKAASPYFGSYEIAPRGLFDIHGSLPLYKIRQVRGQNPVTGVADSAGSVHPFFLKGIVQSPDFSNTEFDFSMKDSTGSIFIESDTILQNYSPRVDDSIEVRGMLRQTNGLVYVSIDSIWAPGTNKVALSPLVVTDLNENNEAMLVKYTHARLVDKSQWVPAGNGFAVSITNGADTILLYISKSTDTYNKPAPSARFNVTGIVSQDKPSLPYIGNYMLLPGDFGDIQLLHPDLYTIGQIKTFNKSSGIADSVNTYCMLKGVVQSGNLGQSASPYYSLQDNTGAIIIASNTVVEGYKPIVGDSIEVRGSVLQKNGLTYFTPDSVSKLSAGHLISPVITTALDESTESELITMQDYTLVDPTEWDTTRADSLFFSVNARHNTDTISLSIFRGTDLFSNMALPSGHFDVTGIGSQNDPSLPYLHNYSLIPRSITDIAHASGIAAPYAFDDKISIFPNPVVNTLNIAASVPVTRVWITDVTGKILNEQLTNAAAISINTDFLVRGIYFIKIACNEGLVVKKFVKE